MITQPLLAAAIEDLKKINWPILCTPKIDGIRCLKIDNQVLSRKFKPIPNKFIQKELSKILPSGFDGEIMLRDKKSSFQAITSAVMSHEGEPDFVYWVFDWVSDDLNTPYFRRVKNYHEIELSDIDRIMLMKPVMIRDEEQLKDYERKCLAKGYEGVMIRDPKGRYKCGRSTIKEGILLKLKQFADSEAVIIGFEERKKNTNKQERNELGYAKRSSAKSGMVGANTLGAFLVEDIKTKIKFSVGSGLDDEMRKKIWKNKDDYIGKIIRYKSQSIGVKEAPRFPIFQGFRSEIDMGE